MTPIDVRTRTEAAKENTESCACLLVLAWFIIPLWLYESTLEGQGIGEPDTYNFMHDSATRAGAVGVALGSALLLWLVSKFLSSFVGCMLLIIFALALFILGGF
jgi:hypothetical protein